VRAVLHLAGKDLRQRFRDRSAILIAVVVPLGLAAIFNLVFGSGATPEPFRYAVVDLDRGPIAGAFAGHVLAPLVAEDVVTLRRVPTVAEAESLAADGAIDAAFVLPAGLSAAGGGGAARPIEVIGSADAPTAADVAEAIAGAYADELTSARVAAVAAVGDGADPAAVADAARRAAGRTGPVAVRDVSAAGRILDVKTFFAASMAVFFLFFTVQFGVSSLIDERAGGTLHRLLAMPVRPWSVLAGKLLTSVLLGLVSMAVLVVASSLLMGASWGDPAGVAALVVAGVLAATGVTAVVASLARTAEQAGSWQSVVATMLGLLGGAFFPVAQVGGALEAIALVTPHAWFLRGLGELAGGGGLVDVLPAVGAMLAFGAVTGGIAAVRLGRLVRP
jgi:ABC-2 type transport system permease protein